jgi:acetyltransferase-like isoleucine patch superfamily enzyme
MMLQGHESRTVAYNGREFSVVIEDDVWIAPNVVVLTGTHIGKGSVISAGAVVSGIIPPYSVVMGNPGRVMANRLKLAKLKAENAESSNG